MRFGPLVLPLLLVGCVMPTSEPAEALPPEIEIAQVIEVETAKPQRRGLFGLLAAKDEDLSDPVKPLSDVDVAEVAPAVPDTPDAPKAVETKIALAEDPDTAKRGLFGLFRKPASTEDVQTAKDAPTATGATQADVAVTFDALAKPPEAEAIAEAVAAPETPSAAPEIPMVRTARVGGFFGAFKRANKVKPAAFAPVPPSISKTLPKVDGPVDGDPTSPQITTRPGFGRVQKACGTKKRNLGKEVGHWPPKGRKIYRLYDSNPRSQTMRDFHVTGFDDRCPRRFQAVIAFLGAPSLYELVRFDPHNKSIARTATDAAYDKVKRRVCGVGPKKPCGRKIAKIERSGVFISAYDRMGDVTRWAEMFLHGGEMKMASLKKR